MCKEKEEMPSERNAWKEGRKDGWVDGWTGRWTDGRREGGREGQVHLSPSIVTVICNPIPSSFTCF